jgi:hypothetical protein
MTEGKISKNWGRCNASNLRLDPSVRRRHQTTFKSLFGRDAGS